jgi:predicted Zn-dependent protease
VTLAWAYMLKGMYPEAVALLEARKREIGPDPNLLSFLAEAYGGAGRKSDAENTIREMLKQGRVHYVSPCHIAGAYIGLQDKDQVLTWLERGFEEHDEVIIWVKVAPDLDFIHSEPRFQALLKRMNFPEQ